MTDAKLMDDLRLVLSTTPRGRVSLEIGDDGHTIEREVLIYKVLEKAIAALEAKPEPAKPLPKCDCYLEQFQVCDTCQGVTGGEVDAKPLPESVEDWIKLMRVNKRGLNYNAWLIEENIVRNYLTQLHSQHQAELELLRSKLALVMRENRRLSDELKKVDSELAAAREQGRREAIDECVSEAASTYAKERNAVFDRWVDAEIKPAREEAARQTEPAREKL